MWKRGEIAHEEQFLLFSTLLLYIFLTLGVKFHIHLLNVVVQFIVFLTLSTLICRGTDILKCFSDPLEFEITRVDCTLLSYDESQINRDSNYRHFMFFFFHFFSFSCKLKSLRGLDTLGRSTLKETFRSPCKFFTFR